MKIVYLSFEPPGNTSGVSKKIQSQILEWRRAQHDVQHLVLNTADSHDGNQSTKYLFPKNNIKPMLAAFLNHQVLRGEITAYRPDVIYIRQMLWWPGLVNCLKGFKVIQELNSDIKNEYKLFRGISSLKLYWYEVSKNFLNPLTSGFVFVTSELATRYSVGSVPFCVIGNGCHFNDFFECDRKNNKRPQLIFVGSPGQPWHGIDKLLQMAQLIPEMDFHIVVPAFEQCTLRNVYCHGRVIGENLISLYRNMDFGVGTLALHRKNMDEASPLKTREYAANGLPIIAGYDDTDLSGKPYFLNIGNYDNNVCDSIEDIRMFVNKWIGKPFPYDDARVQLSYEFKERIRLKFFEDIVNAEY